MILYQKLNFLGILLKTNIIKSSNDYKIQGKYNKAISIFKYGFIIEENSDHIIQDELYDPVKDKIYIADVQKSKATIYNLTYKFPFIKKDFELTKNNNPHTHNIS